MPLISYLLDCEGKAITYRSPHIYNKSKSVIIVYNHKKRGVLKMHYWRQNYLANNLFFDISCLNAKQEKKIEFLSLGILKQSFTWKARAWLSQFCLCITCSSHPGRELRAMLNLLKAFTLLCFSDTCMHSLEAILGPFLKPSRHKACTKDKVCKLDKGFSYVREYNSRWHVV